jgi:hypothetical protein
MFTIEYGSLICLTVLLLFNAIGLVIRRKKFAHYMAKLSLERFFQSELCIVLNDQSSANDEQHSLVSSRPRFSYINKEVDNLKLNIDKLYFAYYIHSNLSLLFLGYLILPTLLFHEIVSPVCMDGYLCVNKNLTDVCSNSSSSSISGITGEFHRIDFGWLICSKYEVETFSSLVKNLAIFSAIVKLLIEINKLIFRWSFKVAKYLHRRYYNKKIIKLMEVVKLLNFSVLLFIWTFLCFIPVTSKYRVNYLTYQIIYSQVLSYVGFMLSTANVAWSTAKHVITQDEDNHKQYQIYLSIIGGESQLNE